MFPLMGALMTSQEVINVEYVGKFLAQLRNLIKMDLQKVIRQGCAGENQGLVRKALNAGPLRVGIQSRIESGPT